MPGKGTSKRYPHGRSIHNPATYEALRRSGMSKTQAARISNGALLRGYRRGVHRAKR